MLSCTRGAAAIQLPLAANTLAAGQLTVTRAGELPGNIEGLLDLDPAMMRRRVFKQRH